MFFFKKLPENELGKLFSDLFLFYKKALYKVKARCQHLSFNIFWQTSIWTYNKDKLYNILVCQSRDMLNFDFLWKVLGLASPHFEYDFLRKIFLMLYSINWPNFIASLSLLLEILGNICTVIISCPVCTS